MKNIEDIFEYTSDEIRLDDAEKAAGRSQLLAVMQDRPMHSPAPIRSPFSALPASPFTRYAAALLLFLTVGSGGVAYASTQADPSSPLYGIKVNITEPIEVALTFDDKKRADLEVEIVDRRLKEIAQASVDGSLSPDQLQAVSDSLSSSIDDAQEDISQLSQTQGAFDSAATLASTLSVHAKILEKVQDANPSVTASLEEVTATLSDELDQTHDLVDTTQEDIDDTATTTIDDQSDEQAETSTDSLSDIREQIAERLSSFDASDRVDIASSIQSIQSMIADAQEKDAAGDSKSAYLLYVEANQQLSQLQAALDADQALGVDVIDATTTDAEAE